MLTNKIFNASALNRYYLTSADPGHPYRWPESAIWTTLVSYIDYLCQPMWEEYSLSFFTCQLLPLIIIFHPPSPINNILFHPFHQIVIIGYLMIVDARTWKLLEEPVSTGYLTIFYASQVEGWHAALGFGYEINMLHGTILEGYRPVGRIIVPKPTSSALTTLNKLLQATRA